MSSPDNFLFWISVTHVVPKIGFICSTLFGTQLLCLNYLGAQKMFGGYKYLMSAFTVLGIVFSTVETLVYPNVHNYNSGLLFFSLEDSFGLSEKWNREIPITVYAFLHSATMALLSVQFIYRYWTIFDIPKLNYFKRSRALIWVAYCTFFGVQYSVGSAFLLAQDEVSDEYFREDILLRYNVNVTEIPSMSIVAYDPVDGSIRWRNLMGVVNIFCVVYIQYIIMIYCGWFMYSKMEDKIQNFSETLKKHHKQFFKTLVLQITTPTIILFIPITIIILLPFFNLNVSIPSGVMLCCFTLYPATDSVIVMYVVSEYRNTSRRICEAVRNKFKSSNDSPITKSRSSIVAPVQ